MKRLPLPLFIACLRQLHEREVRHGSWANGLPDCVREACQVLNLEQSGSWLSVVEHVVHSQARSLLVKLSDDEIAALDLKQR